MSIDYEFVCGKNALIRNVFALRNIFPIFVAILFSHTNMKGFLMAISATVNNIRNKPYASARRINRKPDIRIKTGHVIDIGMAAGW
jgi:hypothetical protein